MLVNKRWMTTLGALLTLGLLGTTPAQAADPVGVQTTLQGCRQSESFTPFPDGGPYICLDKEYTTGNLGKTWNELDLVPYRITLQAGNSAPANQTYTLGVVLDNKDGGHPGYDILSAPVLNVGKSSASCTAAVVSPQANLDPGILDPGVGGTDISIYRLITVTQAKNSTCVYDYYGRLALGSHLFPGSSLHANLLAEDFGTGGAGARDVSIPVKEIEPQEISKTMAALLGGSNIWSITKETDGNLQFGNVCSSESPTSLSVPITVTWTKTAVSNDKVAISIVLSATNPAARTITVELTDRLFKGASNNPANLLKTYGPFSMDIPADTTIPVATITDEIDVASAGNVGDWLHNEVTGTYIDKATGIEVPGTTEATVNAQIQQGTVTNDSATIQDVEDIDGVGLKYAVATPSFGNFLNGYLANTQTDGEVGWQSLGQMAGGSITFSKTVYLDDPKRVTSGTLRDTATLTSGVFTSSYPLEIPIASSASVELKITKSIPGFLDEGEKLEVKFHIIRMNDPSFSETRVITFTGDDGVTEKTVTMSGLVPDMYSVEEQDNTFFADDSSPGVPVGLADLRDPAQYPNPRPVDLRLEDGIATHCSATADFQNEPTTDLAKAQVQKTTEPLLDSTDADYDWTFSLYGPDGGLLSTRVVGANAGFGMFQAAGVDLFLTAEGTYTVVETTKAGWDLISADPDSSIPKDKICDFVVDYPEDVGKVFACSFLNRKFGKAQVLKTVNGSTDLGSYTFTFQLREGATASQLGELLEPPMTANAQNGGTLNFTTDLVPGNTYQLCEIVLPGWLSSLNNQFIPNAFLSDGTTPNPSVDNSIRCADFTVTAGETKVFTIDNTTPPGGDARTIGFWKNWSSCSKSNGKQQPVLDQTLASFDPVVVDGQLVHGVYIGKLFVDTCQEAVRLLSKQDVLTGKQKSSDPAFNMAAQLLAAKLNVKAGAGACPAAVTAINAGQDILDGPPPAYAVNFTGTGDYPKSGQFATSARNLATTLDQYNNNNLCP